MTSGALARTSRNGPRPPLAGVPVAVAMVALALVLTLCSQRYGYHRDELYFRMLPAAWGYLDQPPLTPLLVRTLARLVADQPWAIRIPSTLCATLSVLVLALITREFGGGRLAQWLCAWCYALTTAPLLFGHLMLTASLDLLVWPLVVWLVIRALLREQPRLWLPAGLVVGLSLYNKWLIADLMLALVIGLAVVGPRRVFRSRWPWVGGVVALVVASPNFFYQASHSWPQFAVGAALSADNAGDVRVQMWLMLAVLLGPPMVPVWIAGWVGLVRRPAWRPVRFLALAFPIVLLFTFLAGTQTYYPVGLLVALFAAGWVPVTDYLGRLHLGWRLLGVALVVVNVAVSAVISLPVLPLRVLGHTPVTAINQAAGDQVGWPVYVGQIATAYDALPAADRTVAALVVSNYGEAGAVARYGPARGLPAAVSGHNALYEVARPADSVRVVVMVGGQTDTVRSYFASCRTVATLDNGLGVDNEEQGEPIAICRGPRQPWPSLWPRFRHID